MSAPEPSRSTRDRILDAAEALFAERGLAGTAVRDIAGEVGLNPASLYNHFPSKLALYEAVLERSVEPLLEILQSAAKSEHPSDADIQFIDMVMNHLERTPHLARLIHHEAVTGGVHMARLARVWIKPLANQAVEILKRTAGPEWAEEDYPLLIAAWIHLLFGHFAMAPLFNEVFDTDTLSKESLDRQARFVQRFTLLMLGRETPS
jgi:AcrR family transcriptional regulator